MSDVTESATIDPVDEPLSTVERQIFTIPTDAVTLPSKAEAAEEKPYRLDNPLYDRLYRLSSPRRWWLAVAVGLGLFVGVGQNFPFFLENATSGSLSNGFRSFFVTIILLFYVASIAAALGAFFTPILIAAVGASLTARETTADGYELILLTGLTNLQIVRAYLRIGLKQTRTLWAFYLALTVPALIGLVFNRQASYYGGLIYQTQTIITLLIRLPWVLLGLVWGVWVAQRVRTASSAILGAVIGMFVIQVIYTLVSTFLQAIMLFNTNSYLEDSNQIAISGNELGLTIIGIAIALLIPVLTWLLYISLPVRVRRRN